MYNLESCCFYVFFSVLYCMNRDFVLHGLLNVTNLLVVKLFENEKNNES